MKSALPSTSHEVLETIYKSSQTHIYRCRSKISNDNFIIKESLDALTGILLKQEFELLKLLDGNGAPEAFALKGQGRRVKLFMDEGGETLSKLILKHRMRHKLKLRLFPIIINPIITLQRD